MHSLVPKQARVGEYRGKATWEPGIFSDDVACDVRNDYRDAREDGRADAPATAHTLEKHADDLANVEVSLTVDGQLLSSQQRKPSPMELTHQAAASAITASRVEASLALGRTPIGFAHSSSEICWAISGIPMASFNAAIRVRTALDPDRQIDAIQQTFAQRSMPFIWWVTQEDSEDGIETKLRSHGFDYHGDESIGMAMALSSQPELTPGGESVSVERIFEERDIRTWFATLLESFDVTVDERTMDLATTVYSHLTNDLLSGWHLYLARMGERPVGTCALHLGTTAGLYSVGTVALARRLGVGTALTKRALADASSAGHSIASLTASGLGARLYRALGFREYCRFREYVWRPSS